MRNEQIIAAFTRVVISPVREIRSVESFVATCLHHCLWQTRTLLGMPCYSGSDFDSQVDDLSMCDLGRSNPSTGIKRGNLPCQLRLAPATVAGTATCPAGTAAA